MSHYYTRGEFARALLPKVGAHASRRNMRAMMAWMAAEGDAGRFNPLNTTQPMLGATDFNSVGVKNYASFEDGVAATAETLNYGAKRNQFGYLRIRRALHRSEPARRTLEAVENSAWGTGGLGLRVLLTSAVLGVLYRHHRIAQ